MPKFRTKPVIKEAIQWTGKNWDELSQWVWDRCDKQPGSHASLESGRLFIRTLEGVMHASVGDFIIKGLKGEFYPCKPDIFANTYERVED